MSVKTIFLTSPHSNFIYIFIYIGDRAVVTQRITARKLECGDVRKIVARPEIEMIKKEDRPLVLTVAVLTVLRSSVSRWKRGEGEMWLFAIVGTFSDLTIDFVQLAAPLLDSNTIEKEDRSLIHS